MNDTQHQSIERESGPEFLILMSLADNPKHMHAMLEDIERITGVRFGQDTLYGAIARLVQRGIVEPLVTSDRHQPYWLTDAGAEIARSKFMRFAELANARTFATWKTRLMIHLQPGEQLQDPVRGSYEDSPVYCMATTPDVTSPPDY
jgi:DNA-binding PadR family transcriptional regulator